MASNNAQKSQDRRARAEELRKKQQAQARRSKLFLYGGSFVVALIVIVGLVLAATHKKKDTAKGPEVLPLAVTAGVRTTQKPVVVVSDSSGITGAVAYDSTGYPNGKADADAMEHQHVVGPVTYSLTPPVGGPHNGTWMNCGVYTKPVPNERAVHDLEHGAVWITYRPSVSSADVTALTSLVLKQSKLGSNRYLTLSPWATEDLPTPIVISSWGHQLKVDSASDPRLQTFITAFRAKKGVTPEFGSPCDGVPVDEGGRPAVS
jgi:hypothetical protein